MPRACWERRRHRRTPARAHRRVLAPSTGGVDRTYGAGGAGGSSGIGRKRGRLVSDLLRRASQDEEAEANVAPAGSAPAAPPQLQALRAPSVARRMWSTR